MSQVLLVETKPTMRKILQRALQAAGFSSVVSAEDGEQAIGLFQAGEFQLVIVDWNLPKLAGSELVERIRNANRHVPIFVVTAEAGRDQVRKAMELGVHEYLIKPFTADCLEEKLARLKSRIPDQSPSPAR